MVSKSFRFMRKGEVLRTCGLGDSMIRREEKRGRFPKRVSLSKFVVAWRSDEIGEWLDAKAAGREWIPAQSTEVAAA